MLKQDVLLPESDLVIAPVDLDQDPIIEGGKLSSASLATLAGLSVVDESAAPETGKKIFVVEIRSLLRKRALTAPRIPLQITSACQVAHLDEGGGLAAPVAEQRVDMVETLTADATDEAATPTDASPATRSPLQLQNNDVLLTVDGVSLEGATHGRSLLRAAFKNAERIGSSVEVSFWRPPDGWTPPKPSASETRTGDDDGDATENAPPEYAETEMKQLMRISKRTINGDKLTNLKRWCVQLKVQVSGGKMLLSRRIEMALRGLGFENDPFEPTTDDINLSLGNLEAFNDKFGNTTHTAAHIERYLEGVQKNARG